MLAAHEPGDWAHEAANGVVNRWMEAMGGPRLNAIEMASLRDRIALQLRVENRNRVEAKWRCRGCGMVGELLEAPETSRVPKPPPDIL